ncbi:gliding motility-associated C-terminal domain-containing protein [Mucilaginibacter lappiensis]|uniref:Gliding motility-associated-like protein n=1 Tax=Mucilaginibacter lappiensis TaxID=354630 RepID=A0ABR6PCZ6_9SPHI|nr:MBG domain-containing protein [Mucilaginibacter lappiensis]MBB6107617.1 gliding motility-associated-like protein [Mucilaginibacter lappiensis]SIQ02716.1 gliding motility-associated C-terminal domain-containing protein [Mucilaginibacter lappiensis]
MKKHLLVFFIGLLSIITSLRASAQTFDWSCFPTSGTILADNNGIANLNLTTANCSVANGWVLQCQGTGEQRILSSALGGNPFIRLQKVGTAATFSFARLLTASGALFTLKSVSVTPTSVGAAAGGAQVITVHAFKGGREQGSTSTASLGSVALVNIPESQLGAFINIDEIRFTCDQAASFGVGIDDVVIVAAPSAPTVTTDNSAAITASSATLTGTVTADGGATVTEKGIVYGTSPNPNIVTGTKLTNGSGTGAISANAAGLASGTRYYFRAYATNTRGTAYGADLFFNTLANTAPVAVADNYNFNTGTTLTVAAPGVLGNDTDADGDPLTAILVSGPANGTLALNPNGSFTYTPTGTTNDQFTYKVNDGKVDGNTVTVTLTHVNTAPVVTASTGATVFSGADAVVDPGITVSDDGGTLASGVISITGGLHSAEDQLVFTPNGTTGDITGSYNRLVGVLSLQSSSGVATIAQWQAALRAVVYRNQQVPPTANVRTITFSVNDGTLDSNPASKTVSIALSAISTSGTLSALNSTYGTASASGTFNVSGINLTAGILVTAPTGFEVSMDNTTFAPTVTIGSAGTIPSTPVYIRLAASTNAGSYSGNVVLSNTGASSVNLPTVASTVSPKKLTITAKNITKTYGQTLTGGGTTTEFTTAGLVGTETVDNVTLAYGTGAAANAAVNTYTGTVIASAANGGTFNPANYTINYVAGNIVVNKAALTIMANNKGKAFGSAITGGAGSVDFSSTGLANAETIGSVTITYGAGAAANAPVGPYAGSIVPSAATGGTFNTANYNITYAAGTLTVGQAILTITANSTIKIYGAPVPTLTVSYSGFVGTDNASSLTTLPTVSTTAVTNSPVNTYPITVSGAVSSNYTIVYQPGTITVTPAPLTVTANNATKTYGAAVPLLRVNYSGFVGTDNAFSLIRGAALTTPAVTNSPVGTYTITPSGAVSSNYTFIYQPGTLTVTPAALTITASDATKTYGSVNPALSVTYTGFVGTDNAASLTVAPTVNTTAVNNSPVDTYPVTASGAVSANYAIAYTNGTLSVTRAALTITANNKGKAFGTPITGGPGSVDFTSTGLVGAETIGSVTITYGAGAAANAVAGSYPGSIVPSSATGGTFNAANYNITYTAGTLTVGQAILTITANSTIKTYGAPVPTLTVTYSGFVGTDGPSSLTTLPTVSTPAIINSPVGTYAITPSGAVSSDYTIVYQPGTLSVTPAALKITADNKNKIYGQNLTGGAGSTAFTSTGLVGAETIGSVTINYGTGAAAGDAVNTYTGAIVTSAATGGTFNAANYNISYAAGNITVGKAPITVTANVGNKIYGNVDPTLTYAVTTGALVGTDAFTGTLTRTPGENAGTYAILRGTLALNNNYTLTYAGANFIINKAAITVTADAQTKPYGSVDPALTFKITSGTLKFADTFTGALSRAPGENAGTYAIQQGTLAISSNYALTYAGANLTIGKADITVTADAQSKAFGAADPALTFKVTSGTLKFADTFIGALTRAPGENAGTYAIQQGTLALSSNYNLTYVGANLTIGKTAITVTADVQTKTYGDVDPVLTYKISGGVLAPGDKFTGSLTRVTGENAGTYAIQQGSLTLGSNYTLTYVGANLTIGKAAITITADAKTKAYGDTDPALTYKITSGTLKFADTFTGALIRAPGENAGTYAIQQGTLALSSNYTLTYVGANLTIGKAAITVTADAQTKAYGDDDPALTYKITNGALVGKDNLTGALTRVTGENVGAYAIQQGTLALSNNYTLTYVGANLTIGKETITVTADAQTKVYGNTDPALSYKITNGALVGTDKFTGVLTRTTGENVGTYPIQQGTLVLSNNYTLTYVGANLTIGKAAITVTADDQTKIYGTADPALTYKITNGALIGTDKFTGALSRIAGENAGSYLIQQGSLVLNTNYTLTYVGANLTINKAALTITADAQTKTYGDADPELTYKITHGALIGTDKFTGALTRVTGENVGVYVIQQGTLALNTNYTLTYAGANLTITQKALTITANNATKIYGSANPAFNVSYSGFAGSDNTSSLTTQPTVSTVAVANSPVGNYPITANGAVSANYSIVYKAGTLTVTSAALIITANNATKSYGQTLTNQTASTAFTSTGLIGTETIGSVSITYGTGASAGAGVGTYNSSVVASTATGGTFTPTNYHITYLPGNIVVNQLTLTITANNVSKIYGSANPALSVTYSGFVNGDNSNTLTSKPIITTAATQTSGAGSYPVTVSGAAIANYKIVYVPGTLTVSKATLTIIAEDKSRLYGVANPVFTAVYNGFVNDDGQTALTKLPVLASVANPTSLPGSYPITVSGAASANYSFNYVPGKLTVIALSNAKLINLVSTSGTLTPSFNSDNFNYRSEVDNEIAGLRLTLTFDPTATASINGSSASNDRQSFNIPLNIGNNTISIVVTAQDHVTTNTYTLVIYRGEDQKNIVASNILTPNGDGKNDTWVIADIQLYPNNTVTVFDKGGRTVYNKHGYTNDWNGSFGGAPLTEGTYYYVIDLGPQQRKFKGFITIIHDR